MVTIDCDITTISSGVIAHVVNNRGAMGAGVARALSTKWPRVREEYRHQRDYYLGSVQAIPVDEGIIVVNMIAQDGYGHDGRKYLDYPALHLCLTKVAEISAATGLPCYVPYRIGCGLAGGDWNIVATMLESLLGINVIVCKPPKR